MSGGERPLPAVGDLLAGKYRIVRPIGLGAMGLVFAADHVRLKQPVAIKFMQPKLVDNPEAVARFEREARAASRLTDVHAARIFDVDVTPEGVPYLVSELLEGHDLRQELDKRGKLPISVAAGYIIQACAVMAEAHALGIVHRDLKPSNIFLASRGEGRIVKVLDFGVSKIHAVDSHDLTTTGTVIGSPHFMSPEQVQGRSVDGRTDVWALGVVLFRALAGVYPFDAETAVALAIAIVLGKPRDIRALAPDLPEGLERAIEKALAKDVSARFRTAREFAEALAPFAPAEAGAIVAGIERASLPEVPPEAPAAVDVQIPVEVVADPTIQATRGTWTASAAAPVQLPRRSRSKYILAVLGTALVAAAGTLTFVGTGTSGHHTGAAASAVLPPEPPRTTTAAAPPIEPPPETSHPEATRADAPPTSARPSSPRPATKKAAAATATPLPAGAAAPAAAPAPSPTPGKNPNYL